MRILTKNEAENTENAQDESQTVAVEEQEISFRTGKSKSFAIRLKEADKQTKENYKVIQHELLSYDRVRNRISKPCESFRYGRKLLCKLTLRGKTLRVYLALDPKKFELSKYNHIDVSEKTAYKETPMLMRVRSPRSIKRTIRLIEQMLSENGVEKYNL